MISEEVKQLLALQGITTPPNVLTDEEVVEYLLEVNEDLKQTVTAARTILSDPFNFDNHTGDLVDDATGRSTKWY